MTITTRKRHSPEQVVRKLATADRTLGEGRDVADVCREVGVSNRPNTVGVTRSAGSRPMTSSG